MFKFKSTPNLAASVSCGALALALLGAPSSAKGADGACGAPVDGIVHCEPADGDFATGIDYKVDGDLSVTLEPGLNVAPDPAHSGIVVTSSTGSVVISGADANIASVDAGAIGAFGAGDVSVAIDGVSASGTGAWAITSFSTDGDTTIDVNSVSTNGEYGLGIVAESSTGNIAISADTIDTTGFAADGVTVRTGGDVSIEAGSIDGTGDYVWGVNVTNGGYVDGAIIAGHTGIDVSSIEITGDNALGVNTFSYGTTDIKVGTLKISGDEGMGIRAIGDGDVSVEVGDATFTGENTGAILAFSYNEASIKVGNLTAENGGGVVAYGVEGARAEAGKIAIRGAYANGIQSVSQYGNASLKIGEVSTDGNYATAVNGDALKGDLVVEAGKVTTKGDAAFGIRAFGRTSTVTVTGPVETDGYNSIGILNSTTHGDAVVRTSGTIKTIGEQAEALWITGRYGTADVKTDGKVSTTGIKSHGLRADAEDGQVKVVANEVETTGAASDGIRSRTRFVEIFIGQPGIPEPVEFTGDIEIKAETVKVTGAGSMGISARGIGKASIDVGSVSSADGYAIDTNMIEDVSINVRKSAVSTSGSAILAKGEDVTVNVASGANVTGAVNAIVVASMGDRCVAPYPDDQDCPNPGAEWDNTNPNPTPPAPVPPGVATITNAGTVKGGSGYAVKSDSGAVTLNNSGTLIGAVQLSDGNDTINNSGTFEVTKDSDFGGGTDLFKNSGTVKFAAATAPKSFKFLNLEKFENSGTIDLRNGAVGDIFTVTGAYVGSGSAAVGLDVDLANKSADKIVVLGAATGETKLALKLTAGQARLTSATGITLAEVGTGSSADAFTLAQDIGFIRYKLVYDATARRYVLQGEAGSGSYRQISALEGAENAWHASADAWRSNDTANRDAAWAGVDTNDAGRNRLWGQVYGGRTTRDGQAKDNELGEPIDYELDRAGAQFGFDLGAGQRDDGGFRFGMTAGYAESTLEPNALDKEEIRFRTFNVGAYAGFTSGVLWGTLLAKYDRHRLAFDSEALELDEKLDGSTWGVEVEAGARFGGADFFVEPVASAAWTKTEIDRLAALGQSLDFDPSDGLRGKLGARAGGQVKLGNGDTLLFYGSAKAVHDFGKKYRLTLVSGSEQQEISSERIDTFGEGVIGLSYLTPSGFEGFVEGQGELGSDYDAFQGRVGLRLKM